MSFVRETTVQYFDNIMRTLVIFILAAGAFALPRYSPIEIEPRDLFTELVNTSIELYRVTIPEPIVRDLFEIVLPENDVLQGSLTATNWALSGVKAFQIRELEVDVGKKVFNFVLVLPRLALDTEYTGNMTLALEDEEEEEVIGEGFFSEVISDLEITVSSTLDVSSGLQVHDVDAKISIKSAEATIEENLNPDRAQKLADFINNDLVGLINGNVEEISKVANPFIEDQLNKILAVIFPPI